MTDLKTLALLALSGAVASGAGAAPAVTSAERAAAFPDLPGHSAHGEPLAGMIRADQFEWQERSGGDALKWDVSGWLGTDMHRLWLRDEGGHVAGAQADNRAELLYGQPVAAWWDVVAGLRHDSGPGPSRNYVALGLQGLAPQWLHVEATGYAGEGGQFGLRLQFDYDWLLSNRLILAARGEAQAWSDTDAEVGIGSGVGEVTGGLRLRYEWRREVAPYIGVEWSGSHGETADLAREGGEATRDCRLVAGLRLWF